MNDDEQIEPLTAFVGYALDNDGVDLAVLDQEIPRIRRELKGLGVALDTKAQVQAALNLTRALVRHSFNHVSQTCELEDDHPVKDHVYMHLQTSYGLFGLGLRDRCQSLGMDFNA